MNRTNQSAVIKEAINSCLDKGLTDKQIIYSKVVDDLRVPRPTVRRVARDLRNELLEKINISNLNQKPHQNHTSSFYDRVTSFNPGQFFGNYLIF